MMKRIRFKHEKIATAILFFIILLKAWEISKGPEFAMYDKEQINTVIFATTAVTTFGVYAFYRLTCAVADIFRGGRKNANTNTLSD